MENIAIGARTARPRCMRLECVGAAVEVDIALALRTASFFGGRSVFACTGPFGDFVMPSWTVLGK